jgi:hypothetical protein
LIESRSRICRVEEDVQLKIISALAVYELRMIRSTDDTDATNISVVPALILVAFRRPMENKAG